MVFVCFCVFFSASFVLCSSFCGFLGGLTRFSEGIPELAEKGVN